MSEMSSFTNYLVECEQIDEKFIIKVNSKGEKTKRKKAQDGFKIGKDGKQHRVGSQEKINRSKGAKRGARKRRGKQKEINRKTAKAKARRQSLVH